MILYVWNCFCCIYPVSVTTILMTRCIEIIIDENFAKLLDTYINLCMYVNI